MALSGTTRLLVLQGTPFCNLNCSYCYLSELERRRKDEMSMEIVEQTASFMARSGLVGENLNVLWHAGEPTTLPIAYYESTIRIFDRVLGAKTRLKFSFQTNAIALNDKWCAFIKERNIGIGVSLDGPEHIHDANRKTKNGKGSFALTMRGIDLLKKHGIPYSLISVVSAKSLENPEEIVDFLLEQEPVSIGFNSEEIEAHNSTSSLEDQTEKLREFTRRVYARLKERNALNKCREIKQVLNNVIKSNRNETVRRGENLAFSIVTVTTDGRISTFSPELCGFKTTEFGDFTFGHVSDPCETISTNALFLKAFDQIESGIQKCRESCNYFSICGGGPPSNKLQENGCFDSTSTKQCEFSIKYFADTTIHELINT